MTKKIERCPACDAPWDGGTGRAFCALCVRELGKSMVSYYRRLSPKGTKKARMLSLIREQSFIVRRREEWSSSRLAQRPRSGSALTSGN